MDFTLFDKVQEQFGLVSAYTDKLKGEAFELKDRLESFEIDATKLLETAVEMATLKRKHSLLIEERDQLVMERELMRKKVEQLVQEVDAALAKEANEK
ncbi:hypothetical protein MNBD_NITROSPINAE02-131 [hydrothermal vent metagenome]|uniref:Uncharacterized protein n=1 Tax=hydrothermal vent metagenome TaxID=652676 RepID=A0A3B1CNT0_9ZZZZ